MIARERAPMLVRGVGDVGSAVSIVLFRAGYAVALHDEPQPATPRRGMAFADAAFDGTATLDGIVARRVGSAAELRDALAARAVIPLALWPYPAMLNSADWSAVIDGRMRKRATPERQRGTAPLTIGLGPNFIAGDNVDLAIETAWGDRLGAVVRSGPTLPLAGEPRPIGGVARARFVYAPIAGVLETGARIGDRIGDGDLIATIEAVPLRAPFAGSIRGLTRNGVLITAGAKVIEIDPRGNPATAFGLGERPRQIAEGVLQALATRRALAREAQAPLSAGA